MNPAPNEPPIVVLDTNAVLDWAVFGDPSMEPLSREIVLGRVRWVGTTAMRAELAHVLVRGHLSGYLAGRAADTGAVLALWDRHCEVALAPTPSPGTGRLRCSDPDDQMFIDLAVGVGGRWLISRDRAVLKLRKRLGERGVIVMEPDAWRYTDVAA